MILAILMGGIFLSSVAFTAVYFSFPWRVSAVGRAMITLSASLAVASGAALALTIWGRHAVFAASWALGFSYLGVNGALWTQLFQLFKVQRRLAAEDKLSAS